MADYLSRVEKCFYRFGCYYYIFAAGLLYPLVYGLVYFNESLTEVPVAVVDNSQSSMSRELIRKIDASPDLPSSFHSPSLEGLNYFCRKQSKIIFIPSSFSKIFKQVSKPIYLRMPVRSISIIEHIFCRKLCLFGLGRRSKWVILFQRVDSENRVQVSGPHFGEGKVTL